MKKQDWGNNVVLRTLGRSLTGSTARRNWFSETCEDSYSLYKKDLFAHYGCVNAIEFSNDGSLFVSGGDDKRILLWKTTDALSDGIGKSPMVMNAEHGSNVFCLAMTNDNHRIMSGGNDEQIIIHDSHTAKPVDYFLHEGPVYAVSISPDNDEVFATSCDDGKIRIYDLRHPNPSPTTLASKQTAFHSVVFNPVEGRVVATANAVDNCELWDLRKPKICLLQYPSDRGAMSVEFNQLGTRLLCLRRKDYPIVYDVHQSHKGMELRQTGYFNSCTMKRCSFAGEGDQFAVSGSDDYNIYVWKLPNEQYDNNHSTVPGLSEAQLVLKGHRSIVNHVRYNPLTCTLASCGVEKLIKLWSPVAYPNSTGGLDRASAESEKPRKRFSSDYIRVVYQNGQLLTSNDGQRSTQEDRNMLAFFDLLVQREKEGWSSAETETDTESQLEDFNFEIDSTSTSTDMANSTSGAEEDADMHAGPSGLNESRTSDEESVPSSPEQTTIDFTVRDPFANRQDDDSSSTSTEITVFPRTRVQNRRRYRSKRSDSTSSSSSSSENS